MVDVVDVTEAHDRCLNCGATLLGQYCGRCGQRATGRLISLWELIRDAFGDLFELDSRLWRTLIPLLARPGRLTRDYLEGRRARYMPPFRMYLVLSLLFFLVAFFDPQSEFGILFEPDASGESAGAAAAGPGPRLEDLSAADRQEIREAVDRLVEEGLLDESLIDTDRLTGRPETATGEGRDTGDPGPPPAPAAERPEAPRDEPGNVVISLGDGNVIDCERGNFDLSSMPRWFQRRFTPERLRHLCERLQAAGAEGLGAAVLDRIPAALILLLPIMAFVLKLLYPLSRRYYVEHLLFFVHFHSFFFLLLTLQVLWSRTVAALGLHTTVGVLPVVATSFYIPVYLFVAMRRVYGQGRFATFLKFTVLALAYLLGMGVLLMGALLLAVLSV